MDVAHSPSISEDIPLNEEYKGGIKTIRVLSWNTFTIPIVNQRCLSNPLRCCQWLEKTLNESDILSEHNHNELILCCFQEIWAFKIGICPKFLFEVLKYVECVPILGHFLVFISVCLAILNALIISIFVNITRCYNPKQVFIDYFQQYFGHSVQFPFIPWTQLMDNGLLILSNRSPNSSGYQSYSAYHGEDALVAKGFIWCYFEDLSLLAINTHLQSSGDMEVRVAQLNEIKAFIEGKRVEFVQQDLKVLLCGDFNIDMTSFEHAYGTVSVVRDDNVLHVHGTNALDIGQYLSLKKVSSFQPTFSVKGWENIDHVFTDLLIESKSCRLFDCESSDHRALYMEINIL